VEIVVSHRLVLLVHRRDGGLFSSPVGIEARFSEQAWIIGEQILSISEGVLFTSNAHRELAW
jgi:hypothetical protein